MKVVVQRVSRSQVVIDGNVVGRIEQGLTILLGVLEGDTEEDAVYLAEKCVNLRIFNDEKGKMNLSVLDVGGGIALDFSIYALW